jgi:DNA polymerase
MSVLVGAVVSADEHATIDFETASSAGYVWNNHTGKWQGPPGASMGKKGLPVVGSAVYAEHPSTRVLTLSYKLPGDASPTRWRPGLPLPQRLFDWIARGGIVEAHKVIFERGIWERVCRPKYGFPPLPPEQLSCSMATARVNCFPPSLGDLGEVLALPVRKNKDGRRLLTKFSMPRNPTKNDPRVWILPEDEPADAEGLYSYCDDDVTTEELASKAMQPMTPAEREFWLVDQEINWRGLGVDRASVRDCLAVLKQCLGKYGEELRALTGGIETTQIAQLKTWLVQYGVYTDSLDAEHLEALLKNASTMICKGPDGYAVTGMPWQARRALEIRALSGSASVKKLFAMENMCSGDNRLRDLIVHHGARTGRPTGEGAQPLNMARSGPKLATCNGCLKPFKPSHDVCPWCGCATRVSPVATWRASMVDHVLEIMAVRSLELVEFFFGDALLAIAGCSRGLFVADEGNELVASDYSAIEAVVTGELAGQSWRQEAFRAGKSIYLESASKITGRTVAEYEAYYAEHGDHHPDRQNIGKVAELALGFGGWVNAWLAFDDSGTFNEDQIKELILAWRAASPDIVELWGGQWRGLPWRGVAERFGFEGAAVDALQLPDVPVYPRMRDWTSGAMGGWRAGPPIAFTYVSARDVLLITLPSGRQLTYHAPRLTPSSRPYASLGELSLTYATNNKNPKYGQIGWVRMSTFGGRLMENIVQAVAHDLLRFAILGLRVAGFLTVLHVYDEIVVEIPKQPAVLPGMPDPVVAQVEAIMSRVPEWALGWPVRASGGWRGRRYRKG